MPIKYNRKRKEQEIIKPELVMVKKSKQKHNEEETQEYSCYEGDRFSSLPESLRLHILSSLDAKKAVQTSALSKSFRSLWASVPVLNFHSYNGFKRGQLRAFDKFFEMVLSQRDKSASLERLRFIRGGSCSAKMLSSVFRYVFSHGVKEFEAEIDGSRKRAWPADFLNYTNSTVALTSLILKSELYDLDCLFFRPGAYGLFKNLSVLYLKRGIIKFLEPLSGFPVLEKLTLVDCRVETKGNILSINGLNLSELKISYTSSCYKIPGCLNLTTPKLKFLEFKSYSFPLFFKTHTDLPILDRVVLEFPGIIGYSKDDKQKTEDLWSMLKAVHSVNSFAVFSSVVMQLSLFKGSSMYPFQKLKLKQKQKLDLTRYLDDGNFLEICRWYSESLQGPHLIDHSCSVMMRIT